MCLSNCGETIEELDAVASGILKQQVASARDAGDSVIVTSHVTSELEEIAVAIAFLLDGRVRFAGSIHDLKVYTRQLSLERAIAQQMMTRPSAWIDAYLVTYLRRARGCLRNGGGRRRAPLPAGDA